MTQVFQPDGTMVRRLGGPGHPEHRHPPPHAGARRLHRRAARRGRATQADQARRGPAQGPAPGRARSASSGWTAPTSTRSASRSRSRTLFADGDIVDVTGVSKGKGFAGTVKRHNFSRGPKTHGSDNYRKPGSIGPGTTPGRVYKGMKMGGHMGTRAGHGQEAARRPRGRRAEPDPRQGIGPRRAAARSPSSGRPDHAADHPLRPHRRDRRQRRPRRGAVRGAGERGRPPPGGRRPAGRPPDRHRRHQDPRRGPRRRRASRTARRAPAAPARARAPRRTTAAAASCSARTRARYEQKLPTQDAPHRAALAR